MSLTNITQVRNHLNRFNPGEGEISNRPIRLSSDGHAPLPHAHIVARSETVKALENDIPLMEKVSIQVDPTALGHGVVVPDSMVCAADSSLSVRYQENVDFAVDYAAGTIRRIESGSIPVDATVIVWYLYFRAYQRGIDYAMDFDRGRIWRLSSGAIEEGQEVLVDYHLGESEFSDSEIEQCIFEAESEILQLIDPIHQESTDPALQTAATCLALAFLCRNTAGMAAAGAADSNRRFSVWLDLSQSYRETAMRLLTWFRREIPGFKAPQLT